MAFTPPHDPNYDPATAPRYDPVYDRPNDARAYEGVGGPAGNVQHARHEPREVTAGPFRFSLRDAILGILGLYAILGLALGVLGFAAAFALDNAAEGANNGANAGDAAAALPSLLVSALPFMAAPVLALGLGSWAGHASRNGTLGAFAGGVGNFVGPILMLLITGMGFALGAGAAGLDLSNVNVATGVGPGWGETIPYLLTGAGLLWLIANTISGALSGMLVGSILDRRFASHRADRRRTHSRGTRY